LGGAGTSRRDAALETPIEEEAMDTADRYVMAFLDGPDES
jgi:hypothetical protein